MNHQGFSFESFIVHTVDMAARLIAVSVFCAAVFVWLAIFATR